MAARKAATRTRRRESIRALSSVRAMFMGKATGPRGADGLLAGRADAASARVNFAVHLGGSIGSLLSQPSRR